MSGVTLDTGALIALDRDDRRVIALLARAAELGERVTVPATALAQAIRRPSRQVRLARLVRQPSTDLRVLDGMDATASVCCSARAARRTSWMPMSSSARVAQVKRSSRAIREIMATNNGYVLRISAHSRGPIDLNTHPLRGTFPGGVADVLSGVIRP